MSGYYWHEEEARVYLMPEGVPFRRDEDRAMGWIVRYRYRLCDALDYSKTAYRQARRAEHVAENVDEATAKLILLTAVSSSGSDLDATPEGSSPGETP